MNPQAPERNRSLEPAIGIERYHTYVVTKSVPTAQGRP